MLSVVQFRVVAETPSSFSTKLFGNPYRPLTCLLMMNASRFFMLKSSRPYIQIEKS